ncbi:oligopeptide/dipeptide ABC transporter, ATPase subunit [Beutenbergia cavernae DSM 12333]|uniref:Oligopeptide/dipeptide ABC transporter, ATPase subunit n=1 Tax=Beutenbergia cavernae (strain ATCC BAA-8 / DSM 12333 / CCUG 43141 / JCM 11478 / NBRC 16432 / NCIMB 13614 / HKI 0122) TaxID=471853 RepID=C5C265_BEUC1|nr:ABC transporter ATP-binding protein [Beutenbergia cavernae]ACQ81690.1 oligopeptide/dipeptide ABC transporter, ATPase subunit [Beutenbergia cavernae DSM 12333]
MTDYRTPAVVAPEAPSTPGAEQAPLLRVEGLTVVLSSGATRGVVLDSVSFSVGAGRTTGLIGESGSGKTMSAMAIVRLLPEGAETSGRVIWGTQDLLEAPARRMREVRGHEIGVIFQDPLSALNPLQTVGKQIGETLRRGGMPRAQVRARVLELLDRVGIPDPEQRIGVYPHEMSGGMRQRVMIATALAGSPRLIIADEPTTALDVTTQARILRLLADLRDSDGVAMLLVSHDLRVMAHVADDVVVMYAGRVAERGRADAVLARPRHPYTRALANNVPAVTTKSAIAEPLRGAPANPFDRPPGCAFHPRCPLAQAVCRTTTPELREVEPGRFSACHFAEEVGS